MPDLLSWRHWAMDTRRTNLLHALDPVTFARDRLDFKPDPWQVEVLSNKGKRVLLNCCRQSGKSTIVSILAAHRAFYYPKSTVLLVSRTQRQSSELFLKALDHLESLGAFGNKRAKNKYSCDLKNGSRIVALPGSPMGIRGFSGIDLLAIDEAAYVSDELYKSVRPMLAVSGGTLIAMSTPFGKRGWFFEEWDGGEETWQRVAVPAKNCPRISQEFLEEERKSLGPLWFASEYDCVFVDTAGQMFSFDSITRAISRRVKPLFQGEAEERPSESRFLVGLDLGQVSDYTALAVIEAVGDLGGNSTSYHCRYLRRFPLGTPYPDVVREVQELMSRPPLRDRATLVVDGTGVGRPIVDSFRAANLEFVAITITGGNAVTQVGDELHVPKRDVAGALQFLFQNDKLKIVDGISEVDTLIKELMSFRVTISASGHDRYSSGSTAVHDDLVLALALAAYYARDYTVPACGEIVYERQQYRISDSEY